jgi:hypothetical protein
MLQLRVHENGVANFPFPLKHGAEEKKLASVLYPKKQIEAAC